MYRVFPVGSGTGALQRHKSAPRRTRGDKAAADNRGRRATQKPEVNAFEDIKSCQLNNMSLGSDPYVITRSRRQGASTSGRKRK
ncbi:hypothetical protein RRG08_038649 [Elysia crispata]|uniref:Uncharacterized protein n=1 Tax=Elysia crispata TaxID=231223 RepID=A0AAE0Y260_9GAST|nr:hypothetical protein RRG08_038649 [Elysia crispata]